jgi:hypothetical protein
VKHRLVALAFWLSALAVLGCATTRGYERKLEAWIGKPKASLLANWGEPSQVVKLDSGREIVEYRRMDEEHGRLDSPRQIAAEKKGAPPVGCRTQFLIDPEGQVERWKWVGDHCVAK